MTPSAPRATRCPYCRSQQLRVDPPSRSGFAWHRCTQCGERFSARVVPRPVLKASLAPRPSRKRRSSDR